MCRRRWRQPGLHQAWQACTGEVETPCGPAACNSAAQSPDRVPVKCWPLSTTCFLSRWSRISCCSHQLSCVVAADSDPVCRWGLQDSLPGRSIPLSEVTLAACREKAPLLLAGTFPCWKRSSSSPSGCSRQHTWWGAAQPPVSRWVPSASRQVLCQAWPSAPACDLCCEQHMPAPVTDRFSKLFVAPAKVLCPARLPAASERMASLHF